MEYEPEKFEVDTDYIKVDPDTMTMLKELGMSGSPSQFQVVSVCRIMPFSRNDSGTQRCESKNVTCFLEMNFHRLFKFCAVHQ